MYIFNDELHILDEEIITHMIFTTTRLLVQPLKEADLPYFHNMQSSSNVMKYVGGRTMNLEENKKDLKNIIALYTKPQNDFWVWAVLLKESNNFIGTCAIVKNDKKEDEIGFRFLEGFWSMGYGKEVVKGLIPYAFTTLKLKQVVAYVNKKNSASVKILEHHFNFVNEYYNEKEKCTDRFYVLTNEHYNNL